MEALRFFPNLSFVNSLEIVRWQRPSNLPIRLDYLVISGGGSGRIVANTAQQGGGGGGAGSYRSSMIDELSGGGLPATAPLYIYKGQKIGITVGAGAPAGNATTPTSNGSFSAIRVFSNGYFFDGTGGGLSVSAVGTNNRNGGGSVNLNVASNGGDATAPQCFMYVGGNAFYSATASLRSAGGGAGAGAAGGNATSGVGGNGGAGRASSITGTSVTRAGGGGGSRVANAANQGTGGSGGGGAASYLASATAGTVNTGSGGGGACADQTIYTSGAGGSGIVIIRYPTIYPPATSTSGSPTITTVSGYRIYEFTGSGSITF